VDSLSVEAAVAFEGFSLDVSLTVAAGSCLALAGPSGAGKSTVLRIVAGLVRPDRGRVACGSSVWFGDGVSLLPEERGCGYVFQDYALFAHLPVWQNVGYALPRRGRREAVAELLERFGLSALADARPATLSGGERQRVALARALARSPRALLLDEPLSALDARTRASATRELAAVLRAASVPCLLVTHDFTEAAVLGDEVAVIDGGRVVQRGAAAELAAAPRSAFVADFTGAVVLRGVASAGEGMTVVELAGGGRVMSTDETRGAVAACVFPWEISVQALSGSPPPDASARAPGGAARTTSARNRLEAEVVTITAVGGRVRLGLMAGQPLVAEVTSAAVDELGLAPGMRVAATWKATATRLVSAPE
jgi:molybdate transport system ATP-binding protein